MLLRLLLRWQRMLRVPQVAPVCRGSSHSRTGPADCRQPTKRDDVWAWWSMHARERRRGSTSARGRMGQGPCSSTLQPFACARVRRHYEQRHQHQPRRRLLVSLRRRSMVARTSLLADARRRPHWRGAPAAAEAAADGHPSPASDAIDCSWCDCGQMAGLRLHWWMPLPGWRRDSTLPLPLLPALSRSSAFAFDWRPPSVHRVSCSWVAPLHPRGWAYSSATSLPSPD